MVVRSLNYCVTLAMMPQYVVARQELYLDTGHRVTALVFLLFYLRVI